ncbi:MAG: cysteine desulfurase family protein [Pseudomonadota bacterium]
MSRRIYMDDNASAPLRDCARAAAIEAMAFRNPSAVHAEGRNARALIDTARDKVAGYAAVRAEDVIFTASGSEANMLALDPALESNGNAVTHLLVSAIEHPSVAAGGRFGRQAAQSIPVLESGIIDLAALQRLLSDLPQGAVPLVSVMAANNETGVIQPICELSEIVHSHDGVLHCDAVQVAGRIGFENATHGADLMSISAHKLGGLTGAGALVLRNAALSLSPLVSGGSQERNRRAGTEAVAAIAAFGASVDEATGEATLWDGVSACREQIEAHVLNTTPDAIIAGRNAPRLPNTINVILPGMRAETAVIAFDLAGTAISSGSACSSGKVTSSPVLRAMGYGTEDSASALRISLPRTTTEEDTDQFCAIFDRVIGTLRRNAGHDGPALDDQSTARGAA